MDNKYIVYAHYTADENKLFYIGEGLKTRCNDSRPRTRSKLWKETVSNHGFYYKILYSGVSKSEAEKIEEKLIKELKKRGVKLVNHIDGSFKKYSWIKDLPKEQHPMYGKKCPSSSKRMTEWNKQHSGENHPHFGKKRPEVSERNKTGTFKRFSKKIICVETGQIFQSVREANCLYSTYKSTCITKSLRDPKRKAFGYTWQYVI